jgi:hypothetical protein
MPTQHDSGRAAIGLAASFCLGTGEEIDQVNLICGQYTYVPVDTRIPLTHLSMIAEDLC